MRDSSRPPSPGSCFGTSCAPCAWFVRATLGPRGGPMALGLAIRSMQRCQGIPPYALGSQPRLLSPSPRPYPAHPHPKRVPHHLPTLTHTHAQTGAHADARAHTHAHARTHARTRARLWPRPVFVGARLRRAPLPIWGVGLVI